MGREDALPVAGCRSARNGAGYPRAKPSRQGSRPEALSEAAQGLAVHSASDHDRQAGQLQGCQEGSPAGGGASAAPAAAPAAAPTAEQPSGNLPPADTPARSDQPAVQVHRPGAIIPLILRVCFSGTFARGVLGSRLRPIAPSESVASMSGRRSRGGQRSPKKVFQASRRLRHVPLQRPSAMSATALCPSFVLNLTVP